ncbi:hypothetical protein MGN70_007166 [Eutypa lata]|nr:hypothetical protein MGN70_007144 [Eutypa lata]KAI1252582.1 hypothetical protein MGN70_007161 [Eutypa lata]KAI1252587.1 hypothetical protein MGN70_007166 [Eutypa lata]
MRLERSPDGEDRESLLPLSPSAPPKSRWRRPIWKPQSFLAVAGQCLALLRPSFLQRQSATSDSSLSSEKAASPKSRTEYLDGVRGVASLIVFSLHWSHVYYPSVNSSWGYQDRTSLWLLPFVRLIYSGAAMVAVFFVVSGFVLSHRFIQRMHRHEYPELFASLSSITFRRAIRLFLPAFASSLLAYVCTDFGLVSIPSKVDGKRFTHGLTAYLDFLDMESDPWAWDVSYFGFYNPQLWSIAVEFRGSMVVFLLIIGLARVRPVVRLAVEGLLVTHGFMHKRWDAALFVMGMIIAELEILFPRKPQNPSKRRLLNIALFATLTLGVYLSGYPRDGNIETPGFMWSQYVWPYTAYRRRFWLAVGSILIVGAMAFLPSVQGLFLTRPARYLGRISFALYLVHGLGNRTIGTWITAACWSIFGHEGEWQYAVSFVMATITYFPVVIWASDIFWRAVDIPSTNLAKWVEKKCMSPSPNPVTDRPRFMA